MATLGLLIMIIGGIVAIAGNLMMLVAIFSTGIGWGIGSLFFWPVTLVWLITHWSEGKMPFFIAVIGSFVFLSGMFMKAGGEVSERSAYVSTYSASGLSASSSASAASGSSASALQPTATPRSLPTLPAGGSLLLQIGAKQVEVKLAKIVCADPADKATNPIGTLTLDGDQTHLVFIEPHEITMQDDILDYGPVQQDALALQTPNASKLNIPGMGVYNITSATLHLQTFDPGAHGDSLWHGNISLLLATTRGGIPVPANFSATVSLPN